MNSYSVCSKTGYGFCNLHLTSFLFLKNESSSKYTISQKDKKTPSRSSSSQKFCPHSCSLLFKILCHPWKTLFKYLESFAWFSEFIVSLISFVSQHQLLIFLRPGLWFQIADYYACHRGFRCWTFVLIIIQKSRRDEFPLSGFCFHRLT